MKMKFFLWSLLLLSSLSGLRAQTPFTAGNIAVCRVGDGTATLTSSTAKVFIDEYTPAGVLVQSISLPFVISGANNPATINGFQNSEGALNLSIKGNYLTLICYAAAPGTSAFSVIDASVPKTIVTIKYDGSVNSSNMIMANFSNVRSLVSDGNDNFWVGADLGIWSLTSGSALPLYLNTTPCYDLSISGSQLYSATSNSLVKVGTGLPTSGTQNLIPLPGLSTGITPRQFAFADLDPTVPGVDVLYVADRTSTAGGLKKYSLVAGSWILNGTIGSGADLYSGLAVQISGNNVTVFATRKGGNGTTTNGGEFVKIVDATGYNGTFTGTPTVLASVPATQANKFAFRGVALVPQAPPACASPASPLAINMTPTTALISWPAIAGVNGYQYAVTTSSTPPNSGTNISNNTVTVTGLTNGTLYYAHVRTDCGSFNYSNWTSTPFTTACQAPASPSVNISNAIIATGSGGVKWNSAYGAASYEYALSTSATPPATGTAITDTGFTITGLNSITQYYVHVRSNCGGGFYSPWTTKPFQTGCFMPSPFADVNSTAFTIRWNNVVNAASYDYAVMPTLGKPLSGVNTTDTFFTAANFNPGAGYYFHVRTHCKNGSVSDWNTIRFLQPGLDAYPNPVKETLTLKLYGITVTSGQISMADATGRIVRRQDVVTNTATIDCKGLPSGIYLIRYDDGANHYTVKVMKQ